MNCVLSLSSSFPPGPLTVDEAHSQLLSYVYSPPFALAFSFFWGVLLHLSSQLPPGYKSHLHQE